MKEKDFYKFLQITNDILTNENFIKLKNEVHHKNNRYDHSVRVAIKMYKLLSDKDPNKEKAVRAALLHDFFYKTDMKDFSRKERFQYHPAYSIKNSIYTFNIGRFEREMIRTHMFPETKKVPQNKYSWKLVFADKVVSIREFFKYTIFHIEDNIKHIDLSKDKFKVKEMVNISYRYKTFKPLLENNRS